MYSPFVPSTLEVIWQGSLCTILHKAHLPMTLPIENTVTILEALVGFQSLPGRPTNDIIGYIESYLNQHGVQCELSYDQTHEKANLFATIGPESDGGVLLNGHTDVVPVSGQQWSSDPFTLTRNGNRLTGRGAVDMKGFLACVLASVPYWQTLNLSKPIHIAFTFDEEIGGFGMPVLLDSFSETTCKPSVVIVGEPTDMQIITGHKGGFEMRTEITGHEVHSCDPTLGVSAISVAVALINKIESIGERLKSQPRQSSPFVPPYGTFNIGTIAGGMARNATAGFCTFDWEFRPMPGENGNAIIAEIEDYAMQQLLPDMRKVSPDTEIKIITEAPVPPLDDSNADEAAALISRVTGLNSRGVVSFGSDAGYFSDAGFSTVLFGPGSISRAHKPDEYITVDELKAGLSFMRSLSKHLCS